MNKYYVAIEIQPEKIKEYINIHKNCWPDLLATMKVCGMDSLTIHVYKNIAILTYKCEDLNAFYEKYGRHKVTQRWNELVIPWLAKAPALDGSDAVQTLEKIFDLNDQLENGTLQ